MDSLKNEPFIGKAKHGLRVGLIEQDFSKAFRTQVGINTGGNEDSTLATYPKEIKALLKKELVEIDVRPCLLTIDKAHLVLVLS